MSGDARAPTSERERRPAIVAVDDEPAVLAAVARDLRRAFAERYRILRAPSGAEALEILRQLRTRGDQVALLVADQRMPGMSGTEYLVEARKIVPDAKRVLLTAYADTEAAIAAINEVALDYYLLKPWDPPEEQLYPVVEDLLTTWEAGAALEAGGLRVIGHRFSKDSHDLRDFLARNRVPARWLDVERDGEARELLHVAGDRRRRAARRAARGRRACSSARRCSSSPSASASARSRRPTTTTSSSSAAARPGWPRRSTARPRGCAPCSSSARRPAARPASRAGSRTTSASRRACRARTSRAARPTRRAASAPSCSRSRTRPGCASRAPGRIVELGGGGELSANSVIIASGVSYRQYDAPGFAERTGSGVYYGAALTEARSCSQQHVVIIGAANSAGQAAVHFAGYASQVTMLVRGPSAREVDVALPHRADRRARERRRAHAAPRRSPRDGEGDRLAAPARARAGRRRGGPRLRRVLRLHRRVAAHRLARRRRQARRARLHPRGPRRRRATAGRCTRDPYLLETSVPGVFVAGDVRARSIKRVASAVGEGSMAVSLIHQYLLEA